MLCSRFSHAPCPTTCQWTWKRTYKQLYRMMLGLALQSVQVRQRQKGDCRARLSSVHCTTPTRCAYTSNALWCTRPLHDECSRAAVCCGVAAICHLLRRWSGGELHSPERDSRGYGRALETKREKEEPRYHLLGREESAECATLAEWMPRPTQDQVKDEYKKQH